MLHLPPLIHDLGLILILAGITTLIFKVMKQPVVLGYILAGLLVSPSFPILPDVTDSANIRIWADIGVIILLFNLGLEFSFKKLMTIGGTASITAIIEVSIMLLLGFTIGQVMGWSLMDSIFLGGILSISSTTIILRAFDELRVKEKRFAQLVFGVLIIEDIVAVVLLVLLSTIAVSRQFAGSDMLISILKLAFFLMLWFISGIFFIPTFLRRISKWLNDETLLVVSIGLCLMMVILASAAGFSPALGAFIMGSVLAETLQAERIEHIISPIKDLFGAVFFISVGMLIDLSVMSEYIWPILIITVVFVSFKVLNVTIGALVAGQPLKTSVNAGMSMAQIGEFSFIIATLGITLKVTSSFLYPIAVAISAITTFTTPYMIKLAGPLYNILDEKLPPTWRKALNRYSAGAQSVKTTSDWRQVLQGYVVHCAIFSLIILGVIFLFSRYAQPWVARTVINGNIGSAVTAGICLLTISPFLWALVMRKLSPVAYANLWSIKAYRAPLMFLRVLQGGLAILYITILLLNFFSVNVAIGGLALLVLTGLIFSKRIHAFYLRIEERFFYNFNDRERTEAVSSRRELAPWDARVTQLPVPLGSPVTGITLDELALRERTGVNIAMIRRGEHYTISAPSRTERLYPGDKLFVIGTDDQIELFRRTIEPPEGVEVSEDSTHEVVLKKLDVVKGSFMAGKTIRESSIRERTKGIVVGIERKKRRLLNPESNLIMEEGDRIWIVGDAELIAKVKGIGTSQKS
ncbi:MAG: sodium:proton antiporter [Sphingobacteriales bacterium]|nr:MAG: sodium:proton antiporter [Sphingobacteriales bacterium]